ncbi:hypothetical protein COU80_04545 [Candidatus Peregrinibacteria bacterium CG10_big_fil_rev_8_21_14_0_10_55_24]|nr:MAG: hypothetical protein COU80_04545 [Candidatus Peregrinibacteria bacterium CG10_big_fil_rev_8_21_14_0_10_55_24]
MIDMKHLSFSMVRRQMNFIIQLTRAHLILRNEGSYLGFLWYMLGPILSFIILFLVFQHRLGGDISLYPLYLFLGILVWDFFNTGSMMCLRCMVSSGSIIKSLPLSRDAIVISQVFSVFVMHCVSLVVLLMICLFFNLFSPFWFFLPILLFLEYLFVLGVGFALSVFYVYFRDLDQIWSLLLRVWWFATPIFYALTETGPGSKLNMFNPMYHMIALSRSIILYQQAPEVKSFVILSLFSCVSIMIGYVIFRKLSPHLAEYL